MSSASSSASSTASSSASAASPTSTGAVGGSSNGTTGAAPLTFNDTQILQYALTLEHLEATFYNQSLSKLSTQDFQQAGYNSSVRDQIYSIGRDEAAHVELLSTALGNMSIPKCTYNFSMVTDVESFLTTARLLEGVGVSAYLGAAQNITNGTYLEVAASILVTEGQHESYVIAQTDNGGNAIPNPFSTPLDFREVYSLAAPFFESCPTNASLPITPFPTLTLSGGNGTYTPGDSVTVTYEQGNSTSSNSSSTSGNNSTYLAIIQGIGGPQFVSLDGNSSSVQLPSNLTGGWFYAVVTDSNQTVSDNTTLAGPAAGYVNIPLPRAPEATAASSSGSSSSGAYPTSSSSNGGVGGAGAGPTGTASSSFGSATSTGSASGSSSGSSSSPSSSSASMSQSLPASLSSLVSPNLPTPSASRT